MSDRIDCVVVGYNETPFDAYEALLRRYGERSEVYRDLRLSFVRVDGRPHRYVDLLNLAWRRIHGDAGAAPADGDEWFRSGDVPNLASVYLVNYMRRQGLAAERVNLFQYERERLRALLAARPRCVAITTTFYVLPLPVAEIVRFIRAEAPDVPVVVGGPLVANYARRHPPAELPAALAEMGADVYVNEAQGEATLAALVRALRDGDDLGTVPNLVYADAGGALRATPRRPEANPLDECDIDWGSFAAEDLGPTLQTRTARSCAFRCAFCGYPARAGRLALADVETVRRELQTMRDLGGVRNVVFIDDTFNVPLKRFKALCRMMIEEGLGFEWFSYFRCSNADEEAVELMRQAGCRGVFLGIESGAPAVLEHMHKVATVEQYAQGIEWLRAHKILTFASFIVGFPGETVGTVNETIAFIEATRPDYYRAQAWYCEPGTPIDAQRERYGITGSGFKWRHDTMDSGHAVEQVERVRLTVRGSLWLPQWSFDFWFIPYALGKGLSLEDFHRFMTSVDRLQRLQVGGAEGAAADAERAILDELVRDARAWAGSVVG
jgi:radical SAM PhpK family P-methyltransferase